MTLGSNEHYEVIAMFEKIYLHKELLEKFPKEEWINGPIYRNEVVHSLFVMFRHGVALGKVL